MSGYYGLRIEGARTLRKTMKAAGVDMKDLTKLNREAASTVATAAKVTAPVGDPKNGHIKSTVRAGATQRAGIVRVGNKSKPYGGVIHWGWPGRGIEAQPWVSEAAQATESVWLYHYIRGLDRVLAKIQGD